MTDTAIVVFAKVPEPGRVKTRLTPDLSPDDASRLYGAFLLDTLDQYVNLGLSVRLYLAPSDEELANIPENISVHEQTGADLGERMYNAMNETCDAGHEHAIVIGTDHPTLPDNFVMLADLLLSTGSSLCLGPVSDGGYYLVGASRPIPDVFTGMTYSHPNVFRDTVQRAREKQLNLAILPAWYDVDSYSDLTRLSNEMKADPSVAPRTREVLRTLVLSRVKH